MTAQTREYIRQRRHEIVLEQNRKLDQSREFEKDGTPKRTDDWPEPVEHTHA